MIVCVTSTTTAEERREGEDRPRKE